MSVKSTVASTRSGSDSSQARSSQTSVRNVSISEEATPTRSGYVAAKRMLIGPPSEAPRSAARSEPTASMTARTSSIRVSSVGAPLTRSDIPWLRLSKRIRRENDASCRLK